MPSAKKTTHPEPAHAGSLTSIPLTEVKAGVFKNTCLELMDEVSEHRTEVLITKHGAPVAKLVAPDSQSSSAFGFMRGMLLDHADIVAPDLDAWGEYGE